MKSPEERSPDPAKEPSSERTMPAAQSSLTSRTLAGFFWLFCGAGAQYMLRMLVLIVLARFLGPAEFGLVAAAAILFSFVQSFSQLGIGAAIVQKQNLTDDNIRLGFGISVLLGLVAALVIYALAPLIAAFFRMEELLAVVRVMSIAVFVTGFGIASEALLQRDMQFKVLAGVEIVSYVLGYGAVAIAMAWLGYGVWSLVVAHIASTTLSVVLLLVTRPEPIGIAKDFKAAAGLLSFGSGISLGQFGNVIALQADNIVVGRWLGVEALGVYGRAYQFLTIPAALMGTVINRVLFPAMASVQDDRERLTRAYRRATASTVIVTMPLSGALVVLGHEIVLVLLGARWLDVVLPFQFLAAVLMFRVSQKLSDSLARAKGVVFRQAWRHWVYACAVFGGAWVGHFWGVAGVALGVAAAIILQFLLMLTLSIKLIDLGWSNAAVMYLRQLLPSAFIVIFVWVGASAARSLDLHPFITLMSGLGAGGIAVALLLASRFPVWGEDGAWMTDMLKQRLMPIYRKYI